MIVDLSYTEESNIISKMMVSPKSWTKNEVTDFNFDYLKNEIEINNVDYILDKEYSLTYKDGKASVTSFFNDVYVKKLEKMIWLIEKKYLKKLSLALVLLKKEY